MKTKLKKRTWQVTLTVINDIHGINGTLTKLVPRARIKQIIRDEINNWRDLEARHIRVEETR